MGMSGGTSSGSSSGASYGYNTSLAQSMQNIWGPQAGALAGMFGQATNLANQQQGQVPAAAFGLNGKVQPAAQYGLNQMRQFANPNSALARRQTADLADTVGTEFNRTIMPGINSAAGLGGNIGGSRQALAQGVAAGDAARAISSGATDFFTNAYNQAGNAAAQLPGMAAGVYNLGMQPFQSAWAPLSSLAGILGGPTVLNRSQAMSQQQNWANQQSTNKSSQFGFNLW
jgi:hypothetical protein